MHGSAVYSAIERYQLYIYQKQACLIFFLLSADVTAAGAILGNQDQTRSCWQLDLQIICWHGPPEHQSGDSHVMHHVFSALAYNLNAA